MLQARKLTGAVLIVAASEQSPAMRYATPFTAHDPFICCIWRGKRRLVVSTMELRRARREDRNAIVMTPEDLRLPREDRRRLSGWVRGLLRKIRCRSVVVAADFPLGIAREMEQHGVRVHIDPDGLFKERAIKNSREVRAITGSQRAAVAGMRTAVAMIRAARIGRDGILKHGGRPLTSERVRRAIHLTLQMHDCLGVDTIVAGAAQSADPHCAGVGPLKAGTPIVIDIFPRSLVTGYWGDITRTVFKGTIPAPWRRILAAVKAAHACALAQVRAGVHTTTVHRAAADELDRRGYKRQTIHGCPAGFIHGTGHGVGLEIHEAPSVSSGKPVRLRPNHVITIEPGLYYPGRGGVRIEDLVFVTRHGCRCPATYHPLCNVP